jgi:hypothetical protein
MENSQVFPTLDQLASREFEHGLTRESTRTQNSEIPESTPGAWLMRVKKFGGCKSEF